MLHILIMYFGYILLKTLLDFCRVKIQESYLLLLSHFCELINFMYIIVVMYHQLQNHITVYPHSLHAWPSWENYDTQGSASMPKCSDVAMYLWMRLAGQNVKVGQVVINLTIVALR